MPERFIRQFFKKTSAEAEIRASIPAIYPRLWRFSLALTGQKQAAEDLAQTTVLRALEQASKYQPGTHLDRWLFVMARRIWLNEVRKTKARNAGGLVPLEETNIPATAPSSETNIFAREVLNKVMALPEAQRETVLLVYVEGYSYREAADILDLPIGTVMSRLASARGKLAAETEDRRQETG